MDVKGIGGGFFPEMRRAAESAPLREDARRTEGAEEFGRVLRGRTDSVEISHRGPESTVLRDQKENVMQELKRPADQVTLDGLRNRIASGTYSVGADELAEILGQ